MAELPTDLTDKVINWGGATVDIDVDEPSGSTKAAGLAFEGSISEVTWNWMWHVQGLLLTSLRYDAIRTFDTLPSAIDATSEGDVFRLIHDHQDWYSAQQDKAPRAGNSYGVPLVCTDARNLYYVQRNNLAADTAEPGASDEQWALALSDSGTTWEDCDTDGDIVAICGTSTGNLALQIAACSDGASLFTLTGSGNSLVSVACATNSGTRRVFYCRGTDAIVRVWTTSGGAATFATISGTSVIVRDVYVYRDRLAVLYTDNTGAGDFMRVQILDFSATALKQVTMASIGSIGDLSSPMRVIYDGTHLYIRVYDSVTLGHRILRYSAGELFGLGSTSGPDWELDSNELGSGALTAAQVKLNHDDRHLYATTSSDETMLVIDKVSGKVTWTWDLGSTAVPTALAVDGRYLWTNVQVGEADPKYITAFPLPCQTGLWHRQGDCTTTGSEYQGVKRLAIPQRQAL